ncbi:MAG: hypothetical protein EA001_12665 [Oscillatoriales cyanobacterium]|nr:MAG: hypothetical protein EA001_12665 [Oscillatoriales cyanobacterium]
MGVAPWLAPAQLVLGLTASAEQSAQMHRGFQKTYRELDVIKTGISSLQSSVGILQASQAILGVGVVAGVVLAGANLWQTMKLRQEVQDLRIQIKQGFLDLTNLVNTQSQEIKDQVQRVAEDIKFEQHRVALVRAYGQFCEANRLIKRALDCDDLTIRNSTLSNAELMLSNALADYRNPQLLSDLSAAARLRRLECCWAIEQALALTFQLRGQYKAVVNCLSQLRSQIAQAVIDLINPATAEEVEFLVPELLRIYNADLEVIDAWINHADWIAQLSQEELLELPADSTPTVELEQDIPLVDLEAKPTEVVLYESWTQKMPLAAIQDATVLMFNPDLRMPIIQEIQTAAQAKNYRALNVDNLQSVSDPALASLKQYFRQSAML